MLQFAPGEDSKAEGSFSPSVLLFWLKTRIAVTDTRIVAEVPNTLFGVIPLGSQNAAFPLPSVASVGVNTKVRPFRFLIGMLLFILGVATLSKGFGIILLLLGAALAAGGLTAELRVENSGGSATSLVVSLFEQARLRAFAEEVNQRVFANLGKIRHQETIHVAQQQLTAQTLTNQVLQGMAPPEAPRTTPAGWYPATDGSGRSQWWDGRQWTDQFGPSVSPAV